MHSNLYSAGSIRTVRRSREHLDEKLGQAGSSAVRSEATSILSAPYLCVWAIGLEQRSGVQGKQCASHLKGPAGCDSSAHGILRASLKVALSNLCSELWV